MADLLLQWGGSALVLVSYVLYRYGGLSAPIIGFFASALLTGWTVGAEAWGYFTLNMTLCGINAWTLTQWYREGRTLWGRE